MSRKGFNRMTKIIAVTNRKGGVGKTTMLTHVAAGLATMGYRVGVIDTDSQGHAGFMLKMPDENGLFEALIEKAPLEEVVRLVPPEHYSTPDQPARGSLYLLPSSDKTYKIPFELAPDESFLFLQRIEDMVEQFTLDVVLIDTNPTMTMFDGAVYLAADGYIYVTECERLSFDGINKAIDQMERARSSRKRYLGRDSRILGIIPNKMRARTHVHRYNIAKLGERYPGLVWSPVILGTIWTEASNLQELVYTYAPGGDEAANAWRLVGETEKAIAAWEASTNDVAN